MQFEKQIRDLASSSISQLTAPESPDSKIIPSLSLSIPSESRNSERTSGKTTPQLPELAFELFPEKEVLLKNSLNELKSSLSSLISSAELFSNSVSSLGKSSDWKYSESKGKDDSLFTFQEGHNNVVDERLDETKKSSLMSPLRESDLKNSKEGSSGLRYVEKLHGTPVSEILELSDKPSSSFNKAFLTLDELQVSSSRKKLFETPEFSS